MMNIGIRAVRSAGDFIIRSMDQMQGIEVTEKSRNDYVSEVDRRAELMIIDILRKAYPDHAILAEESGRQGGAITSGSSTRSTARQIFCMVFRSLQSPLH